MSSFYQTPPQQFLDDMHKAGVSELFDPKLTQRNRAESIQATKRKISRVKQQLQEEVDTIRGRVKIKNDHEAQRLKLRLRPYYMLLDLVKELELQVKNLEDTLAAGKLMPQPVAFGEVIFGNIDRGEWFLGDDDEAALWDEAESVRSKLDHFMKQRDPLVKKQQDIKERHARIQERFKKDSKKYNRRRSKGWILMWIVVMLIIAGGFLGVGYLNVDIKDLSNPDKLTDSALGLILVAIGGVVLVSIPIAYSSWKHSIAKLEADITTWKHEIEGLKHDMLIIKRDFGPVNKTCKELQQEYKELRAHFG